MLKKLSILLVISFVLTASTSKATLLSWADFADVKFESKYNEKYGIDFLTPTFGKHIKSFEGKEIKISGYFLDLTGNGTVLLLSKNPYASCFHCGGAGPETVIELYFKEKPSFKTDEVIEISGVLELNADDVSHCNYILKDVEGKKIN